MAVRFLGTFHQTIDSKGRLFLPARFKRLLTPADLDTLTLIEGVEPCLILFPLSSWEQVQEEIDARPKGAEKRKAVRGLSLAAVDLELDANGRLTLPRDFLQRAGIEREIEVVGQLRYIELWSPERHAAAEHEWREASKAILDEIL